MRVFLCVRVYVCACAYVRVCARRFMNNCEGVPAANISYMGYSVRSREYVYV